MPGYQAPIQQALYLLGEVFGAEAMLAELPGEPVSLALMGEILDQAGRFCAETVQPLNRTGDAAGCRLADGAVSTPPGYRDAYAAFVAGGWPSLSHDPAYGGQGLPRVLQLLLDEMLASCSMAFGLLPGLTRGAVEAIARHADDALKAAYLPNLVSGRWAGAMALTEAHAGSDLGLLRCRAAPAGDGSHRISGSKIFISNGDHDLTENIVHLVLARLPDAPAGTRGISLFLVPKFLPAPTGPGRRNAMSVGSIERKMGLHGSPTCAMHYDGASGWLIGEAHRGLPAMFTMMNAERLFVGMEGLGVAEAAYQAASSYAKERLQGRAPGQAGGPPQPIIAHPDVRKMLLTIRCFTEAGRALAVWTALQMEVAARHPDPARRGAAEGLVSLLTPVIKAAFTDLGFEAAVLGQQVLGGHGYIREGGVEQFVRDARICQIYEGTNGIQAMDLVSRKLLAEDGALPRRFFTLIQQALEQGIPELAAPLDLAMGRLEAATTRLITVAALDGNEFGAAATDYLRLFALTALGWMWLRMASTDANHSRLTLARFFMGRILPQTVGLALAVEAGADSLMALPPEKF